jgi:hypothetical protein
MVAISFVFSLGLAVYERVAPDSPGPARTVERIPERTELGVRPATLYHLQQRVEKLGPEHGSFWRRLSIGWESVNVHVRPFYDLLQPITRHLPVPAQDFNRAQMPAYQDHPD